MSASGSAGKAPMALARIPLSDKELDLKALNKILSSAQSREKVLKVLQYSSRLVAYFLVRAAVDLKNWGKHFESLAKQLSLARRCFKFLRWFKHFEDIPDAGAEKDESFKQLLYLDVAANVVADVSEDICSLEKVGFLKKGVLPKRTEYYANWCQLVLAAVEILVSHTKVRRARAKAASDSSLDNQRKSTLASLELSKYYGDFFKALFDCELRFSTELGFILGGLLSALVSTHKYALKCLK